MAGRDVEADLTQHDMVIEGERDTIEADRKRLSRAILRISLLVFETNVNGRAARCHSRCAAPAPPPQRPGRNGLARLHVAGYEGARTRVCASSMIPFPTHSSVRNAILRPPLHVGAAIVDSAHLAEASAPWRQEADGLRCAADRAGEPAGTIAHRNAHPATKNSLSGSEVSSFHVRAALQCCEIRGAPASCAAPPLVYRLQFTVVHATGEARSAHRLDGGVIVNIVC